MTAGPEPSTKLSICIPTYNFGEFIGETLESILPQLVPGVEVVILDGGSTDDTEAVVRSLQQRYPELRYDRRAERGGIDRDMARTVEQARGEYCWLFSSDDLMKPSAIREVLAKIESGHDIYLCGLTICSFDMRPLRDQPVLEVGSERTFDLSSEEDRRAYFDAAATTTAFFSFLGSVIFKRERWVAIPLDERFVGSCWAHVARIFAMLPAGLVVRYLPHSYLWKRSDNDSFMERGLIRRYAISIDGYHRLARTFFDEDGWEARNIRRVVANEFHPRTMLYAKSVSRALPAEDQRLLERLAREVYSDRTPRNLVWRNVYRWTPVFLFTAIAKPYRRLMAALGRR